ncbi:MAG: hypothetical protein HOP12_08485 [Candidatus Eisenbacteria bacterium]|uniref:Gingipain domain-containing protein n=1 Tax=Eiseniibacteriota bacterium TaxID=2212470 RepID=A0A849SYM7_UNCEI|nr:hypothetical protein [Candidatus Eisenbacteria bacterium]
MNPRLATWLCVGLAALAPLAHASSSDVTLLPTGPGVVRFSVELPAVAPKALAFAPTISDLAIPGWETQAVIGETRLPVRVFSVAVPPGADVRVSGRIVMSQTSAGVVLATQPRLPRDLKGDPWLDARVQQDMRGNESAIDARARGAGEPTRAGLDAPVATLLGVGWMRDQRVARIAVSPARYDVASRRLELAQRVEVQVQLTGGDFSRAAPSLANPVAAGAFESVYQNSLVNPEQGREWRRERGGIPSVTAAPETSLYAGRSWIKIPITQRGFHRVDFNQIRLLGVFRDTPTPALDSLRLFTWPGYPILPEMNYCDSCDFREVAIQVVDDGDGRFDGNDYFYFHALGTNDWGNLFDSARPDTEFVNNPYETRNYYYLTIATAALPMAGAPHRILTRAGTVGDPTGAAQPTTFNERMHFEQDVVYEPNATPDNSHERFDVSSTRTTTFWEKWFWNSINQNTTYTPPPFALPGYAVGQPARFRALMWGFTDIAHSFGIFDHYADVRVNGSALKRRAWEDERPTFFDSTLVMQPLANLVDFTVPRVTDSNSGFDQRRFDQSGLAWFDVFYPRRFEPLNNSLAFGSTGLGEVVYTLRPFTDAAGGTPMVFDVTDPGHPVQLLDVEYTSLATDDHQLRFRAFESGPRRYAVLPIGNLAQVATTSLLDAPSSSLQNLRGRSQGADYLLIYFDGFRPAADELLRWRRDHLPPGMGGAPFDTASVPISALYDQFSGGRADPSAVRNFLRAVAQNWAKIPTFVTFLGDASYDYKNITGLAPPGLPGCVLTTYEGGFDAIVGRQYTTDDWILNVDSPFTIIPDFASGRIPAEDLGDALLYVRDKLIPYESSAPVGTWRNTVMLVADDDMQGSAPDNLGWSHVQQSGVLDRSGTPLHIDRDYVYLHTYPTGPNFTKPGAKSDILAGVNSGVLMMNYIGHGSPFKLADESVFLDADASAVTNATRPTVLVAASCDVGKYSDPKVPSLGEGMLLNPTGGAIGVISATELAFSNQNAALNLDLYQGVFERDPVAGLYSVPLASGLLDAKNGTTNGQKYQLMGDAALRLLLPSRFVEAALADAGGAPLDTVQRGQTVTIRGRVADRPGGVTQVMDGALELLVEDSAPIDTVPCVRVLPGDICQNYPFRAAPMFRGTVPVRAGVFEARFVVPIDSRLGVRARHRGYFRDAAGTFAGDGVGADSFAIVIGIPPSGDQAGPQIALAFPGGSLSVRPTATLRIDLTDPSGILITGRNLQNGIIVTVDENSTQRYDVTSSFQYAEGSYQSGTATFDLPNLSAGPHRIRVSAADNLAAGLGAGAHRSSVALDFAVSDNPELRVSRALLFPNPIRSGGAGSGGTFVVDVPGDSINVLLRIYTVSGRLVRSLTTMGALGQVQLPWDGLDSEGERLATGVYLFRVHANLRDPDGSSSARQSARGSGRFVVHRP